MAEGIKEKSIWNRTLDYLDKKFDPDKKLSGRVDRFVEIVTTMFGSVKNTIQSHPVYTALAGGAVVGGISTAAMMTMYFRHVVGNMDARSAARSEEIKNLIGNLSSVTEAGLFALNERFNAGMIVRQTILPA